MKLSITDVLKLDSCYSFGHTTTNKRKPTQRCHSEPATKQRTRENPPNAVIQSRPYTDGPCEESPCGRKGCGVCHQCLEYPIACGGRFSLPLAGASERPVGLRMTHVGAQQDGSKWLESSPAVCHSEPAPYGWAARRISLWAEMLQGREKPPLRHPSILWIQNSLSCSAGRSPTPRCSPQRRPPRSRSRWRGCGYTSAWSSWQRRDGRWTGSRRG